MVCARVHEKRDFFDESLQFDYSKLLNISAFDESAKKCGKNISLEASRSAVQK